MNFSNAHRHLSWTTRTLMRLCVWLVIASSTPVSAQSNDLVATSVDSIASVSTNNEQSTGDATTTVNTTPETDAVNTSGETSQVAEQPVVAANTLASTPAPTPVPLAKPVCQPLAGNLSMVQITMKCRSVPTPALALCCLVEKQSKPMLLLIPC